MMGTALSNSSALQLLCPAHCLAVGIMPNKYEFDESMNCVGGREIQIQQRTPSTSVEHLIYARHCARIFHFLLAMVLGGY